MTARSDELVDVGFRPREHIYDLEEMPGAWVELRRLDHGQSNELTDVRLAFVAGEDEEEGQARLRSKSGRHFQFSRCIVAHNLSVKGQKLDFKKRRDVDRIDPVVGDEIANLIDEHNSALPDDLDPLDEPSSPST